MSTTVVDLPATVAHLSAVRVGNGTAVHAGTRANTDTPAGGPLYIAACGAGRGWRGPDSTWSVAMGEPITDRVTCRNCTTRHAGTVARIHTTQGPAASTAAASDAGWNPAESLDPVPEALLTWGAITHAAGRFVDDTPTRRLRAAWVNAARRMAHGLPPIAHDGRRPDADVSAAQETDGRSLVALGLEYLAAYSAVIYGDSRAEDVDTAAHAYAAPDDAAQQSAGTRPAVGTPVMVAGHAGRWEIVTRGASEQGRRPYAVRVQRDGHPLNASVPLAAVRICPPAPTADKPTPDQRRAWQAVHIAGGPGTPTTRGGLSWTVYAADNGAEVGTLWHDRTGKIPGWSAVRDGHAISARTHVIRADALASVGWLDTVPAATLTAERDDVVREALNYYEAPTELVLADGLAVHVESAELHDFPRRITGGPWTPALVPLVTLHVRPVARLELFNPRPVQHIAATGDGFVITFRADARVTLTPPCDGCSADAGAECSPDCLAEPN